MPEREQGDDVLARVLGVYDLDLVLPAVGRELLARRRGRAREVELQAGNAARGHLLRELARDIVGKVALVARRGEDAHEVLDVFLRPGLARVVY